MIFVVGIPRSGTSLTAGLIALSEGIHTGSTIPGNKNNEKGFYESAEFRNKIVKPYLISLGRDPMGQYPLPDPALMRRAILPGLRTKVEGILQTPEGMTPLVKEPKLLLMWPAFHRAFPEAKWVVVRRDPEDILDSVMRTNFMRAYKTKEEWRPWLNYYQDRLFEVVTQTKSVQFWPSRVLDLPSAFEEASRLESFLDIKIPVKEAQRFLDPTLWNRSRSPSERP